MDLDSSQDEYMHDAEQKHERKQRQRDAHVQQRRKNAAKKSDMQQAESLDAEDDDMAEINDVVTDDEDKTIWQAKWKRTTRDDRAIAQVLEEIDDRDLSIHLFNTHALNRQVNKSRGSVGKTKHQGSNSWRRKRRDKFPIRGWTAWPLEEPVVPRPQDDTVHDSLAFHTPTAELEQCIIARMLEISRIKMSAERETAVEACSRRTASSSYSKSLNKTQTEYEDAHKLQMPLFLADDDKARDILQSSARRVIGSLDRLLTTLYQSSQEHTRRGQVHAAESSRRRSPSATRDSRRRTQTRDWSEVFGYALQSQWPERPLRRAAARCSELFGEEMMFRTSTATSTTFMSSRMHNGETIDQASRGSEETAHSSPHEPSLANSQTVVENDIASQPDYELDGDENGMPGAKMAHLDPVLASDNTHLDGFMQTVTVDPDWWSE